MHTNHWLHIPYVATGHPHCERTQYGRVADNRGVAKVTRMFMCINFIGADWKCTWRSCFPQAIVCQLLIVTCIYHSSNKYANELIVRGSINIHVHVVVVLPISTSCTPITSQFQSVVFVQGALSLWIITEVYEISPPLNFARYQLY